MICDNSSLFVDIDLSETRAFFGDFQIAKNKDSVRICWLQYKLPVKNNANLKIAFITYAHYVPGFNQCTRHYTEETDNSA